MSNVARLIPNTVNTTGNEIEVFMDICSKLQMLHFDFEFPIKIALKKGHLVTLPFQKETELSGIDSFHLDKGSFHCESEYPQWQTAVAECLVEAFFAGKIIPYQLAAFDQIWNNISKESAKKILEKSAGQKKYDKIKDVWNYVMKKYGLDLA